MGNGISGNDPAKWDKLLESLDNKLQFGLLDQLRRVKSYHFEDLTLFIEVPSAEVEEYLKRGANFQQLQVLAHDATGVEKVVIKRQS